MFKESEAADANRESGEEVFDGVQVIEITPLSTDTDDAGPSFISPDRRVAESFLKGKVRLCFNKMVIDVSFLSSSFLSS